MNYINNSSLSFPLSISLILSLSSVHLKYVQKLYTLQSYSARKW